MKSDSKIERMYRLRNRSNPAKRPASLLLMALVGVLSVTGQTVVSTTQTSSSLSVPGELNARRSDHTATLLTNGKVVIAGGTGDLFFPRSNLLTTELFDPETGTWSVTGSLHAPRIDPTATLLNDGRVLTVVGKRERAFDFPMNSAELYDPVTGQWSATGNLKEIRQDHSATLLPDGKVLVAGGANVHQTSDDVFDSVELFDPVAGTWSETGRLNTPRAGHTATLLQNGKVLAAGGGFPDFGGPFADSAELYDPNTGTWSTTGKLSTPRINHTATLLPSGKVLVAGGLDEGGATDSAELYDPETGTWSNTGNLNEPRQDPATLLTNGKVLIAGGSTAELYDPETGTWSLTAGLNAPRSSHTATLLPDGRLLVAGGSSTSLAGTLNSFELYDPNSETWIGPPVPVITGTSIVDKKLFVFGENFGPGAVILRNGIALRTKDSSEPNTTKLVAKKKAGIKTKPGDRLQVLNRSGALSREFVFAGS